MRQLTEKQFDFFQQYLNMVSGIEDGFVYVIASFTDFSKTEGDLVLTDIIQALTSITYSNTLLERLLIEDVSVQQAIIKFQDVADAAFKLEGHLVDYDIKTKVINDFLYPAFSAWREMIEDTLVRHVVQ